MEAVRSHAHPAAAAANSWGRRLWQAVRGHALLAACSCSQQVGEEAVASCAWPRAPPTLLTAAAAIEGDAQHGWLPPSITHGPYLFVKRDTYCTNMRIAHRFWYRATLHLLQHALQLMQTPSSTYEYMINDLQQLHACVYAKYQRRVRLGMHGIPDCPSGPCMPVQLSPK